MEAHVIRVSQLAGRAVIDVDLAEKLGRIDRVVLDPDARRVAGFIVKKGSSLLGGADHLPVSAAAVHAIGPDAITVHGPHRDAAADLAGRPRVSDLVGRKVVSDDGRFLGTVDDVLIDETDGRILGYTLAGDDLDDKIKRLLSAKTDADDRRAAYLRADANLRAGRDLIVAPDDAISTDWEILGAPSSGAARVTGAAAPATRTGFETPRWEAAPRTGDRSTWIRSKEGSAQLERDGTEQ